MMVLTITASVALVIVLATWWMRHALPRPVPVRSAAHAPPATPARGVQPSLMSAPVDVAGQAPGTAGEARPGRGARAPKRKPSRPTRRSFLKTAMSLGWLGVLGGFGTASLAFLWPNLRGGFGASIPVDTEEAILASIDENGGRFEFPQGRALFVRYDANLDPDGQYADITNGTAVMALYQRCVHLGCKVPWCDSAKWWECPCHGSKYNRWGEWQEGPAPRGLDRFAVQAEEGRIVLDTSTIVTGPSRAAPALNQPPEGPHCVEAA